jgi:tRNA U34 2-thiouridine synthase MnmA/TrmU
LPCELSYNRNKKQYKVTLKKAIIGVSEGQAVVLYKGKEVLGGGVIEFN